MGDTRVARANCVVGAAAVFAPTSYARLRLLRQLHACGLLCDPARATPEIEAATPARRARPGGPAARSC